MEKQLEVVRLASDQGLMTLSNTSLVIAEQPDKKQVIKLLANMLHNLSKLYQLPNWTEENAVILGTWVYDNYKYDSLDDVIACLANPPQTGKQNWRLTPDTITEWMGIQLEKASIEREKAHNANKEKNNEPLENVDYEAFKERIAEKGLPKTKRGWDDPDYVETRNRYLAERIKKQVKP